MSLSENGKAAVADTFDPRRKTNHSTVNESNVSSNKTQWRKWLWKGGRQVQWIFLWRIPPNDDILGLILSKPYVPCISSLRQSVPGHRLFARGEWKTKKAVNSLTHWRSLSLVWVFLLCLLRCHRGAGGFLAIQLNLWFCLAFSTGKGSRAEGKQCLCLPYFWYTFVSCQ